MAEIYVFLLSHLAACFLPFMGTIFDDIARAPGMEETRTVSRDMNAAEL